MGRLSVGALQDPPASIIGHQVQYEILFMVFDSRGRNFLLFIMNLFSILLYSIPIAIYMDRWIFLIGRLKFNGLCDRPTWLYMDRWIC